ncbi:MAG: type II 3-dehydroquinate dehydratase [Pseudomonadota bacterium]
MTDTVFVLNGPNLNMLGQREPEIYGSATLREIEALCRRASERLGLELSFRQSNTEGTLVDWIQNARDDAAAIVLNPAAYTHTSVALLDALNMFEGPVIEVHLSNPHRRESFRHRSYVSLRADGVIAGCGAHGYELALRQVAHMLGP